MSMPTFIAQQATRIIADGGTVLVYTRHPRVALDTLAVQVDHEDITRICRANGNEGIDYESGGRAIIVRHLHQSRRVGDVALVVAHLPLSAEDMEQLVPCIVGTANGQMVAYY